MTDRCDVLLIPLGAAAYGGAERSLLDLASGLARLGRSVEILADEALSGTPFRQDAEARGVPVHWAAWGANRSKLAIAVAAHRFLRAHPARVICFNISWRRGMWLVPVVGRLVTRSRIIGTMRAMPDPHHLVPRRRHFGVLPGLGLWHLPEVLVGWIWSRSLDLLISTNAGDYPGRLTAHYGYSPAKIRVIYNGVPYRESPLDPSEREAIRQRLGIAPGEVLLGSAGRVSREKGIHHLVEAMARLPARFKLLLLGDGPQRGELESLVSRLCLVGRVIFHGFVSQPDDLIAACDLVVVPSVVHEAFGRTVVEAMNEGVPVVASRVGGMAELFTDGVEGVYVKPQDVSGLAAVLLRLGSDGARLRAMGRAARELVRSRYSLARTLEEYDRVVAEMLGPAAPEPPR